MAETSVATSSEEIREKIRSLKKRRDDLREQRAMAMIQKEPIPTIKEGGMQKLLGSFYRKADAIPTPSINLEAVGVELDETEEALDRLRILFQEAGVQELAAIRAKLMPEYHQRVRALAEAIDGAAALNAEVEDLAIRMREHFLLSWNALRESWAGDNISLLEFKLKLEQSRVLEG